MMDVNQQNEFVGPILDKLNTVFNKIKLSGMPAEDAVSIKRTLDGVNDDIGMISEFCDSNDPIVKEIKRLYEAVNNIFTQLDPCKDIY